MSDEHLAPLAALAEAQCTDAELVAAGVCDLGLKPSEATQLVERYSDRWEHHRTYGQAKMKVAQYTVAVEHSMTAHGRSMLAHLGAQHLGQVPGGPMRELNDIVAKVRKMSPAQQAQYLRQALGRIGGAL